MLGVWCEQQRVGILERTSGGGLSFAYDPDWIREGFAISVSMPLVKDVYPIDVATPWFANLLPEEPQLEMIGQILGRAAGDTYGILEEIGRDTAGALSIGDAKKPESGRYQALDEHDLAAAIRRLPQRPLLIGDEGVALSLAGAQSKMLVAVIGGRVMLPINGAASTHILKPANDRLYASVANELMCMRLASAVGIPTPEAAFGRAGDQRYLLVRRYDRSIAQDGRVTRRHQEDFCQALGRYPTEKYQASGGPGLQQLFEVVVHHSAAAARDRLTLLDMVIFSCCIGDTDRHAKNYSLLLDDRGWRLAPHYDAMTSLIYSNITRNMAMKIADNSRAEHLQRRHWENFAQAVGLAPAATVRRVEALAESVLARLPSLTRLAANDAGGVLIPFVVFQRHIEERTRAVMTNCRL
ncbi:type II toxin-antitoxin system HipA family toxin [Emcibacter sp. SYSU 3D8]|uniref:type II toxin-antitoxin system HipA family toxin n=1 Tax=Emcibacter sp. SYSU 3D8 TaxID=3133969 RepID=UPI0031FE9A91